MRARVETAGPDVQPADSSDVGAHAGVVRRRGPDPPLPPTMIYAGGFAFGLLFQAARPLPLARPLPMAATFGGTAAILAGTALFAWALGLFARCKTGIMLQKPAIHLVARGPYRWSRNPQYVSFVVIYLGASLIANTWWPVIFLPLVVAGVQRVVIAAEERHMRATFRAAYDAYCRRVRRWL